jgi:hypothetical protein
MFLKTSYERIAAQSISLKSIKSRKGDDTCSKTNSISSSVGKSKASKLRFVRTYSKQEKPLD